MDALRGYTARTIAIGLAIGLAAFAIRELRRSARDADIATAQARAAAERAWLGAQALSIEVELRSAELVRQLEAIEARLAYVESHELARREREEAAQRLAWLLREQARVRATNAWTRHRDPPPQRPTVTRIPPGCLTSVLCR